MSEIYSFGLIIQSIGESCFRNFVEDFISGNEHGKPLVSALQDMEGFNCSISAFPLANMCVMFIYVYLVSVNIT